MTVNERLSLAGLMSEYDRIAAVGDLDEMNRILARVNLRRDADGMHWSLENGKTNAPNQ